MNHAFFVLGDWYEVDFRNGDVQDCHRRNLVLVPVGKASAAKRAGGFGAAIIDGQVWFTQDLMMKMLLEEKHVSYRVKMII